MNNPWTEEEDKYIKENYKELSASQMSTKLPGRSRSAVIGRLHRLGLTKSDRPINRASKRPTVTGRGRTVEKKRSEAPIVKHNTKAASLKKKIYPYAPPVVPKHIRLMDLKPNECRFPLGDGPFTFCGNTTKPGESYCPHHGYLSYRQTSTTSTP
jgi:GcrA cell cycle regulator